MNLDKCYKSLLKNASVDQQSVEDRSLKSVCFADAKGHELDLHPPSQFYFEELNRQKVILECLSIVETERYQQDELAHNK
ncbi:hypothetical protein MXB_2231 [Myxobolus squamalis]|nr:hypothetical protein MXB_2231 [Myxobolus squamalis]